MDPKDITRVSSELNKVKSAFEAWRSNKTKEAAFPRICGNRQLHFTPNTASAKSPPHFP